MLEAVVTVALRAILASVLLGGVLSLLVLLATRSLALSATTRHGLWTTALVAMALMPPAGIGFSLMRATAAPTAVEPPPGHTTHATRATITMPAQALPVSSLPATHDAAPAVVPRFRAPSLDFRPRLTANVALGLLAAWALGALIGLVGLVTSVWRVRGLKHRSSPLDAALSDELPWLTEVGPGREIYLRLSYETETPVAIGFRRSVILIPTELATADGLAAIEPLVLHEHAHLRRYDDWTNLVQRVIERIFWFNPLVWVIGRRIALEREIASDDAVVERTGAPADYATSLWRLAREMRMPEHAVVAPGAMLTRKQISVRIEQLLDANRGRLHRSPATALGVATAAVLAVGFVATSSPAVELPPAPPHPVLAAVSPAPAAPAASPHVAAHALPHAAPHIVPVPHPAVPPRPVTAAYVVTPQPSKHPQPQPRPQTPMRTIVISRPSPPPHAPVPSLSEEIQQTVHDALASVPAQIAAARDERSTGRASLEGQRLSREMVASCMGCSMQGADLHGLDLHGLSLSGITLRDADLRGVNLSGAHLTGSSLMNANLTGADLRGAELNGVTLRGAKLDGALLDGARFMGISLQDVSVHGTALRSIVGNCVGCNFRHIDLHAQDLHGISLAGVDLREADLHEANLSGARLAGVNLSRADLHGADLTNARFEGCTLSGADLHGTRTDGMVMHGSVLE